MASHRRGLWSKAEDEYLLQLVHTHGPLNWAKISQMLGSRTKKQCRERYHQTLRPNLNHHPITPEEGAQIERLVLKIGKRWTEIARRLHGRSDNAVKNWWNGSQKRRKRLDRRRTTQSGSPCDEHCPRSLQAAGQPPPFSRPKSMQPSFDHSVTWPEASLPSPCSPESSDTETCVHYTASPRMPDPSQPTVRLPPLRAWTSGCGSESTLPDLNSFAHSVASKVDRRHQAQPHGPLPTASNFSVQRQHASSTKYQDSRMSLSTLLK